MSKDAQIYEDLKKGFYGIFVQRIEEKDSTVSPLDVSRATADAYAKLLSAEVSNFTSHEEVAESVLDVKTYAESLYQKLEQQGWGDIQETLNDMNNRLLIVKEDLREADLRLTAEYLNASARIDAAETRISAAEVTIDSQSATIAAITEIIDPDTGILTGAKLLIDGQTATLESFAEKVNTHEGTIVTLDTRMSAAEGTITTLADWKDTASDEIHTMQEQWNVIDATIITTIATELSDPTSAVTTGVTTIADGIAGTYKIEAIQEVWDDIDGALSDPEHPSTHSVNFAQFVVGVNGIHSEVALVKDALDDGSGNLIQVSTIDQKADSISLRVTETEEALSDGEGGLLNVGEIALKAGEIDILVDSGGNVKAGIIVQAINAQTGSSVVTIDADKIALTGEVIANKINAGSGTLISGWTFSGNAISNGHVYLDSNGNFQNRITPTPAPGLPQFYWSLNQDGSGSIAKGNVHWDSAGAIYLAQNTRIEGTNLTMAALSQLSFLMTFFKPLNAQGQPFDWDDIDIDEVEYISTPYNLCSEKEITAGGIGSGGGGGGGAKFLYQLEDIYNNGPIILRADGTARQSGDALTYDSTQNKWIAASIQSGASSFAQLTGSPYDNTNLATVLNNKQDALGYTPVNKAGDTMSGSLELFANGSSWNEGIRMHLASNDWVGLVMCGSDNTGNTGTSAKTWSIHNYDGHAYFVNNGSSSYTYGFDWTNGGALTMKASSIAFNVRPTVSGTNVALTSDIPTNNNQLTNGAGYITSSGSCAYATSAGNASTLENHSASYFQPLATAINTGNIANQSVARAHGLTSFYQTTSIDLNTYLQYGGVVGNYGTGAYWNNGPSGMSYGSVAQIISNEQFKNTLALQLAWDINHDSTSSTKQLWFRASNNLGWQNDWKEIYHTGNCNNTSIAWSCSNLTASGNLAISHATSKAYDTAMSLFSPNIANGDDIQFSVGKSDSYNNKFDLCYHHVSDGSENNALYFNFPSKPGLITLLASGNVGIGTTSPSEKLHVAGNIVATGNVAAGSDARWKHNIRPVFNSLDAIIKLQPSEWEWNSDGKKDSGLVAQQVREVLPHLVKEDNDGFLHLNYNGLHAYEISALQNHETEIDRLRKRVSYLEAEVKRLRS